MKKHGLMTIICIVGMGAVLALALPGVRSSIGGLGRGSWVWLMALLCPLSHVLMMRGMHHGSHAGADASCHGGPQEKSAASEQPPIDIAKS